MFVNILENIRVTVRVDCARFPSKIISIENLFCFVILLLLFVLRSLIFLQQLRESRYFMGCRSTRISAARKQGPNRSPIIDGIIAWLSMIITNMGIVFFMLMYVMCFANRMNIKH